MERLSALINRLKERHESGGSNQELLLLVDQLKNELTVSLHPIEFPSPSVSVMMPVGYQPVTAAVRDVETKLHEKPEPYSLLPLGIIEEEGPTGAKAEMEEPVYEKVKFESARHPYSVPRPPVVAMVEEEVLQEEKQKTILPSPDEKVPDPSPEPSFMDDILGFLNLSRPEKKDPVVVLAEEKEEIEEKPLVFELHLNEEEPKEEFRYNNAKQAERKEIEDILTLEMPQTNTRPKELHEILAARVVASPSPSGQSEGVKILSEKLGSSKITDLKKGIGINDRFRFIKSLFRGDETLFDRSVKTINNFNILPEAQYWIQRELVIKLGWNDEDELVQQFYSLVSRRFL